MKYDDRVVFEYFETGKAGLHGSDVLLDGEYIAAMYERETNFLAPVETYYTNYTKILDWNEETERLCDKYSCDYVIRDSYYGGKRIYTVWRGFEKLEELIDFHIELEELLCVQEARL